MCDENTIIAGNKDHISYVLSVPEGSHERCVLLLHCFLCTKEHRVIRNLSQSLEGKGLASMRFDFAGNGQSPGKLQEQTYTRMLIQVRAVVDHLQSRGFKRIGIAGHSLGAMLSLLYAGSDERIKSVAFISGSSEASRVRAVFPPEVVREAEEKGDSLATIYGKELRLTRDFILDTERYNVGLAVSSLKRPILIIHGSSDEVIPFYHARQLFAWAQEPKQIIPFKGADHQFRNREDLEKLAQTVTCWFEDKL